MDRRAAIEAGEQDRIASRADRFPVTADALFGAAIRVEQGDVLRAFDCGDRHGTEDGAESPPPTSTSR
jgi:hypothetical protein